MSFPAPSVGPEDAVTQPLRARCRPAGGGTAAFIFTGFGPLTLRRRGFAMASTPLFIKIMAMTVTAMAQPGKTKHHHSR